MTEPVCRQANPGTNRMSASEYPERVKRTHALSRPGMAARMSAIPSRAGGGFPFGRVGEARVDERFPGFGDVEGRAPAEQPDGAPRDERMPLITASG